MTLNILDSFDSDSKPKKILLKDCSNKDEIEDTIAFYCGINNPGAEPGRIAYMVSSLYNVSVSNEDIDNIKATQKDLIKEYRRGGTKTVSKALAIGELPYGTPYARLIALSQIIDKAKEGYYEEKLSSKGEIFQVKVIQLSSAIEGIKAMHVISKEIAETEEEGSETLMNVYSFLADKNDEETMRLIEEAKED